MPLTDYQASVARLLPGNRTLRPEDLARLDLAAPVDLTSIKRSWLEVLDSDLTDDCLCDIGMPVMHRGVRYNCRVLCLARRVLLIRPKLFLANDNNYRERRYFQAWQRARVTEPHALPRIVQAVTES